MTRIHIRIVAALVALAVLTVTVLGAVYMYREKIVPEQERKKEVAELMKHQGPKVDPGLKFYDQAMALIRQGEMEAAREKLTEIIEIYRDSARFAASRAVLGEMNMDRLFSRVPMPGKLEYTVGRTRQDNLNGISTKFRTTIAYIKRVNNLLGNVIHPGDRLVLYPLDFEVEVHLAEKRLTLLKDGRFFKDYAILSHHLPMSRLGRETTISESYGWLGDRKIRPDSEQFFAAGKWLQTAGKGSRAGVILRPEPPPAAQGTAPPTGVFLDPGDMHELSTVLRPGTPLRFI